MDITLRQLRYFRAVAETGSFTRAAQSLFVSQPTVSGAVKELERQVGLPLLEPLSRRVQVTQAGRILLQTAERVLEDLDSTAERLAALTAGKAGRLALGASSTPG